MPSPSRPPSARSLVLVTAAAASWGTTGSVSTLLAERAGASPLLVGAGRMVVAAGCLAAASLLLRAPRLPPESRRAAAAMGACMAAYQVAFFAAVPLAGIAVSALVAICSAPLLIALLARVVLGERLPARAGFALVIGLAGAALLVGGGRPPGQPPAHFGAGAALALAAGAAYSAYAVLAKLTLARADPLRATGATFAIAAGLLCPALLLVEAPARQVALGWPWLLYLGAVATAGAYAAYSIGLREVPASLAGILALAEPLTAALLAVGVFGERLSLAGALGAALVFAALTLLVLPTAARRRAAAGVRGESGE